MNILLISPYFFPAVGGVETHLNDLCKYLKEKKNIIFVRTYKAFGVKDRGETYEGDRFLKIHRLWWPDFNLIFILEKYSGLKFLYLFIGLFFDCLLFLFKKGKDIDIIQTHGFIAALIAVILGKIFNKKVVINTHVGFNLNDNFMTRIIRWTLLNSDKILVLTPSVKKSLTNLGVPDEKIEIYHYWVDQKIFNKRVNAKEELKWKDQFIVLFVGRLIEVKGVLKIFSLASQLKDITFAIAGSGPLSEEIAQKSKEFSNVIFLGKVGNDKLPLYYSGADLLLIPSNVVKQEYEEGIPRVMIEALSCSLPVISTKSGGIPDVFSNKIGVLVEDNLASMKKAIEVFSKDSELLKNISENCRGYALNYFSSKNGQIIERSLG